MKQADLVLKSSAIFTGTDKGLISGGVAISENRIVAVEEGDGINRWVGEGTLVKDFGNKMIQPGFIDAHMHYLVGAISASDFMCTEISESTSEEECVEMIKQYADAHPEEKRIRGIGWFPANWNDSPLPTKESLDKAIPDRPVYLICADVHTFWMNSMALKEAGITPDMKLKSGEVGVDEKGELNGLLFEPEAFEPAMAKVMEFPEENIKDIHRNFLRYLAQYGITSVSDMSSDDYTEITMKNYSVMKNMEEELTSRIHLYTRLVGYTDFSVTKDWQKKFCSEKVRIAGVKGFVDGVTSTYTGYLLEPYTDRPDTCGEGVPIEPKEGMQASIIAANAVGLPVRLHCIGDAAVRMALDMYEESNKVNENLGFHNTVEHIESIHPDDIPRFAKLNVIPSMQPYHLTLDVNEKVVRIGKERCRWEWPHRALLDEQAVLAFGTDYPVVEVNPFPNIYAAITRKDDEGIPTGQNPEECITLEEALKAYTVSAANAYGRTSDLGTLESGKLADIVVVDRNLFESTEEEIRDAFVECTIMNGKVVYTKD